MIRCRAIRKSYPLGRSRVEALRGVDLEVSEPGFYAIMGASGSGKSTLLHLLAALDTPDEGEIEVAGRRLDGLSDAELTRFRRHEVGIVFQQFNLIPTMTALENVELPGVLAGERGGALRERARGLLDMLGLAARAGHRPEALSGGEQQRVAIARALLFSPGVLLADEPTGNLDSRSSEALWDLLDRIARERSMTVAMVTHEPAAAAHCREIFVLQDGRVSARLRTEGADAGGVAALYQRAQRPA
ncbi:MAG: ABC transporter ATP-binding protein [Planctomycetota bacterium]|nr:ABC transporter ATP-binding protein [Planctomycetota bacterium]